jgi:hypothetical protein
MNKEVTKENKKNLCNDHFSLRGMGSELTFDSIKDRPDNSFKNFLCLRGLSF